MASAFYFVVHVQKFAPLTGPTLVL